MANTFGKLFRVTSFGESHGEAVGVIVDGCPAGIPIHIEKIQLALNRRRPGQSEFTSPRKESDKVECLSGIENGFSLGTPITLIVRNQDTKPQDYADIYTLFRPSHGDFTTQAKYGIRASSGGGRTSARETLARVAAGSIAEQVFEVLEPELRVVTYVHSVKDVSLPKDYSFIPSQEVIDKSPVRCPDDFTEKRMQKIILEAKEKGDTVGGVISCLVINPTVGLGEPVFDKLEAELAKAMLSLPAAKGFEIGSGFAGTLLFGSENNDEFVVKNGKVGTLTNNSGGIQAGISNGETITMKIAFKPVSTLFKTQKTLDENLEIKEFTPKSGRHDPCVLPRAVPMVESMALIVLMDYYLINCAYLNASGPDRHKGGSKGESRSGAPLAKISGRRKN